MKPIKFKVKLFGLPGMETAGLRPPFDVPETFGTKARVPVRGTINGAAFRSSLMNMGSGHCMVVNASLRAAANVKAGDVVIVVMERDDAPRVVTVPPWLKKIIHADARAKATWSKLSYSCQKEHVLAITDAKQEETRERRVAKMMAALKAGSRKK